MFTMSILGLGVDIVEIARISAAIARQGQALVDRCFLPSEQEYCARHREPARQYAARFAAKEAVAKALGTGIGGQLGWLDIEVVRKESGAPVIVLHGVGAETAKALGVREILVSLSHSEHYAVANALALGG
jgi:holo-[acyl-carrier protein] synthase